MIYKSYKPKTILNVHQRSDAGWFWDKYSASAYIGCEHGCEYCYLRDEKYNPHRPSRDPAVLNFADAFSEYIKVKENASELLRRALTNKPRDVIYLNSYQPAEARYQYCRKILEVCLELGFPTFINEKSPLLLRDSDLLKKIHKKSYLNVGWSIITVHDDATRLLFEPKAPPVSARFSAMRQLSENNITTGTVFMPILPFIYDNEENIKAVVRRTKECGGKYVLEGGLTLWGYCRTHFYQALRTYDSALIKKYDELYGNSHLLTEHVKRIHDLVTTYCREYELTPYISRPIAIYPEELRMNKRIAEMFYREARELQLSGGSNFKQWAYRKAAWALDDLGEGIEKIFQKDGVAGIMNIKGIGKGLAKQIEELLKEPMLMANAK